MRLDLLLEFEDEILSYLIFILFIMSYRILLIYYLTRSNLQSLTFHLSLILYHHICLMFYLQYIFLFISYPQYLFLFMSYPQSHFYYVLSSKSL